MRRVFRSAAGNLLAGQHIFVRKPPLSATVSCNDVSLDTGAHWMSLREGLPIGVQIVGPWLEDRTTIKLGELIEREFGGFKPPPMFDD